MRLRIDDLVTASLEQLPETVVYQLASEVVRLRSEIADLKRGGVVVPELLAETTLALIAIDWPNHTIDIIATARNIREWLRKSARTIPADRELMRLVDELIRWHGLRPLDKRPDHAAVLVGAIKALRAQPTQELAP